MKSKSKKKKTEKRCTLVPPSNPFSVLPIALLDDETEATEATVEVEDAFGVGVVDVGS